MENGVKEKAYMALYARVREAITGGAASCLPNAPWRSGMA